MRHLIGKSLRHVQLVRRRDAEPQVNVLPMSSRGAVYGAPGGCPSALRLRVAVQDAFRQVVERTAAFFLAPGPGLAGFGLGGPGPGVLRAMAWSESLPVAVCCGTSVLYFHATPNP